MAATGNMGHGWKAIGLEPLGPSFAPYSVIWGKSGRITEIAAAPATHACMAYRKPK